MTWDRAFDLAVGAMAHAYAGLRTTAEEKKVAAARMAREAVDFADAVMAAYGTTPAGRADQEDLTRLQAQLLPGERILTPDKKL